MPTAIAGAIPHATQVEDEIDEYVIPAGSTIVLAVWTINNDPELFPNPRDFDPLRHNPGLSSGEAAAASDVRDRDHWTFGAGRRICPGMHVAERMLFIAMARILWAFDMSKAKDLQGREIDIDRDEITQSIAARPLPFRCEVDFDLHCRRSNLKQVQHHPSKPSPCRYHSKGVDRGSNSIG